MRKLSESRNGVLSPSTLKRAQSLVAANASESEVDDRLHVDGNAVFEPEAADVALADLLSVVAARCRS